MIAIDGFPLLFLPGGIKSYLIAILKALNASDQLGEKKFVILLPKIDQKISAFYHSEIKELEETLNDHFTFQYFTMSPILFRLFLIFRSRDEIIRRYTLFIWEHYSIPRIVAKLRPSVIFHPYQAVSDYKTSACKVVVVHDIFHWDKDQHYTYIVKRLYHTYKSGCVSSDTLITISQTSKDEILRYLRVDEKKIVVCYEGVDDLFLTFKPSSEKEREIVDQYKLPKKYLLALVSVREYKNIKGVIEVFNLVSKKDPEFRLVLVGWALESNTVIVDYIRANKLEDKIVTIPKLSKHQDLAYLYHGSYAFLFLSFKEGFGLPPLEAIACNSLSVVSNVSAVGEIYNGILPSFDPKAYQEVADYILSLTAQQRNEAIILAQKKLLDVYSWEKVLPQYLQYLS